MKKIVLAQPWLGASFRKFLLVAIFLAFTSGFAQQLSLNESFEEDFAFSGWTVITPNGDLSSWEINSYKFHSGSKCMYVGYDGQFESLLITPKLAPIEGDSIKFYLMLESPTNYSLCDTFAVMVSTTGKNLEDFAILETVWNGGQSDYSFTEDTWTCVSISLEDYIGSEIYIAFKKTSTGDCGDVWLDDVSGVNYTLPTCVLPVASVTTTTFSATVTLQGNGANTYNFYYKNSTDTEYGEPIQVTENDEVYYVIIDDLEAGTIYDYYVEVICGEEDDTLQTVTMKFITACEAITEFPWTEGFEGDWTNSSLSADVQSPLCWANFNGGVISNFSYDYIWQKTDTAYTGTACAGMYTDYANNRHNDWLISPSLAMSGNQQVSFYARSRNNDEIDEISIWISDIDVTLTAPNNSNDTTALEGFTKIASYTAIPAEWTEYTISLSEYTGNRRIAFVRRDEPTDGWWLYIDDVTVEDIPTCVKIFDSQCTADVNTATITANGDQEATYVCYYRESGTDNWNDPIDVINMTVNLTELSSITNYEYYFATICGEDTAFSKIFKFATQCASLTESDLPRFWDFESGNVNSDAYGYYQLPKCWQHLGSSSYSVSVDSYNAYDGGNCLRFSDTYGVDIALLPQIDTSSVDISALQVSLYAMHYSWYSTDGTPAIIFGVMTDPTDASTFVGVDTVDITTTYSYYEAQFSEYTGNGTYVAIKTNDIEGTIYIDNLILEKIPQCAKIQNSTVSPTANGVTVTIAEEDMEENVSYKLLYKKNGADTWEQPVLFVDGVAEIESGLKHSTVYQYAVVSVCLDESEVQGSKNVFTTLCQSLTLEDLPVVWDFEGVSTGGTQDNHLPPCWGFSQSSDMGRISTSTNYAYQGEKYLNMYSTDYYDPTYLALPQIDTQSVTIDQLQLSFYIRTQYLGYAKLEIGVCSDPSSDDDFVLWDVLENTSATYQKYTYNFTNYNQGGSYIVIRTVEGNSATICIDNMTLCLAPECVTVSSSATTTTNSANITMKGKDDASYIVYYKQVDAEEWSNVEVSNLQAEINELQPATAYQYYVATICGEDTLNSAIKTIVTQCVNIELEDLPVVWDFEQNNYAGMPVYPLPVCWQRIENEDNSPYVSAYSSYQGEGCLRFGPIGGYAILPTLNTTDIQLNTLQLTFYAKNNNGVDVSTLEVGVMTDPTDTNTYEVVSTVSIPGNSYSYRKVRFSNYTGEPGYIVLKCDPNDDYRSTYVDNLTLEIAPDCQEILLADIDIVTTTDSMAIKIAGKEGKSYKLYYKKTNVATWEEPVTFDVQYNANVTGLTPATDYVYYIVTICDDEDSVISETFSFQTGCEPIVPSDLPKTWNFEANNTAGTTSYPLPICWQRIGNTYPYVFETSYNANGGTHCLYMTNNVKLVILQEINTDSLAIADLQISFYSRNQYSYWGNASIEIGSMTDPADASTFTVLSTLTEDSDVYSKREFSLVGAPSEDRFIAMRGTASSMYIDDLTIDMAPTCPKVSGVNTTVTDNTATITWNQGGDNITSWKVYYRQDGAADTTWQTVDVANDPATTITGLTANTSYTYQIEGICTAEGESNPKTDNLTFNTLCSVVIVTDAAPWVEDFSTEDALDCWSYSGWIVSDGKLYHQWSTDTDDAIIGTFDLTSVTNPYISFNYSISAFEGAVDHFIVKYRDSMTGDWTELASYTTETQEGSDTLALPNPSAMYQINFFFDGKDGDGVYVDDIEIFNNISAPMPCNVPKNITLTDSSSSSLTIAWEGTASKYKVQKNNDTPIEVTQNSYTFNGLNPNTNYNFKVQSVCGEETSDWSATFTAKTLDITCEDVTALSVSATTQTTATITWNGTANGYDVKLGENGNVQNIASTSYTFTDLTANTTYTAMVRSNCGNGKTSQWQSVTFKTDPEAAEDCDAPTDLVVDQITQTSAVISWTGTADGYEVQIGISEPVKTNTNTYAIDGLTAGNTYTVKVRSICSEEKQSEFVSTTFTTLSESGLIDIDNTIVIATYPNPTTTNATLEVKGLTQSARVIVTDVMGRVVASDILQAGQQVLTINSESFVQGVYYIRVVNDQINKTSTLIKK